MTRKTKKYPECNKKLLQTTLDDYFIKCEINRDVFGFLDSLNHEGDVSGYFAVFDINGQIKSTNIYTKEILEDMVIPDILKTNPNSFYKIFPEEDFDKIVKR